MLTTIIVTFREGREYLGIETQRKWSDLSIDRSTPFLFMLYTLIVLIGNELKKTKAIVAESTAWNRKTHLTFSDLLQAVRKELGQVQVPILNSVLNTELEKIDLEEGLPKESFMAMGF